MMGHHRRVRFNREVEVFSIQELSGESRSPTPINGLLRSSTPIYDVETESENPSFCEKENSCPVGSRSSQKTLQETQNSADVEMELFHSEETTSFEESYEDACKTEDNDDRYRDFLMSMMEENQNETMKTERQVRQEKKEISELRQEMDDYKLEYYNYHLSMELDLAEIERLKYRLLKYERVEGKDVHKEINRLEEENEKLKQSYHKIVDENTSMRKIIANITNSNATTKKDTKVAVLPKVPQFPAKIHRRPYTGKSREVHLPPIGEHNNVVASLQQTTEQLTPTNKSCSPLKLPSIPSAAIVPTPPTYPRQSSSRRPNKVSRLSAVLPFMKKVFHL